MNYIRTRRFRHSLDFTAHVTIRRADRFAALVEARKRYERAHLLTRWLTMIGLEQWFSADDAQWGGGI